MNRFLRFAPALVPLALAVTLTACTKSPNPGPKDKAEVPPVETGAELYAKLAMPKPQATMQEIGAEPIVAPQAIIQFDQKIQVPAEVDGHIEIIGSPLPADARFNPADSTIIRHPRDQTLLFTKLQDTYPIALNQLLVRLDESQILIQREANLKSLAAMDEAVVQSKATVVSTQKVVDLQIPLVQDKSISPIEFANSEVSLARAKESLANTEKERAKIAGDVDIATSRLQQFGIRSPVDGRILKLLKNPGEFVKAGEPIMEVQATSRFRVEAKVDSQIADKIKPGMAAVVEPIRPHGPEPYTAWHGQDVTGIAITAHKGRPLIVSGSLDGRVIVWDVTTPAKRQTKLKNSNVAVRSIAATGPGAAGIHLVATGGADGKVRLFDLAKPDALPDTAPAEFDDSHGAPVIAAAFSPDGRWLATAAGREVFVWDVAAKKKKYALPVEHLDDVTALRFTPQSTLLTVARDKTARFYTLGNDAAALAPDGLFDHRAGSVDVLGLSSDGGRILFDRDADRMDLMSVADKSTVGTLQNGGGLRFAGLALFSPDDRYILTATGDSDTKGEMQLWELSKNVGVSRGSERRRLVTPRRAAVTCAAFSPDAAGDWIAVGTQTGGVHFWSLSAAAKSAEWHGIVVSKTELDSRSSQIRIEVSNPGGAIADQLQDRGTATIIIDPKSEPKPLPAPVPPPKKLNVPGVGTKADAGEILPATFIVPALRTLPGSNVPPIRGK